MCLEFGSCFGGRRRDDYGRSRSRGNHGNGGYWLEPAPAYRQPPIVAVHEARHDGQPKADHADAGSPNGYADLQDKAGSDTPWHNKVGDNAGYGACAYTPRAHEAAAAMDCHQYPATTTTLARYQVASR